MFLSQSLDDKKKKSYVKFLGYFNICYVTQCDEHFLFFDEEDLTSLEWSYINLCYIGIFIYNI